MYKIHRQCWVLFKPLAKIQNPNVIKANKAHSNIIPKHNTNIIHKITSSNDRHNGVKPKQTTFSEAKKEKIIINK